MPPFRHRNAKSGSGLVLGFVETQAVGKLLADSGVAVTVLPATDLFLTGRDHDNDVPRSVTPAHRLLKQGVTCSLSTNNVLNPFTPFGDCSLVRIANLYANVTQVGTPAGMATCLEMVTSRSAKLMNLGNYGVAPGKAADFVVLDCSSRAQAVAELAPMCSNWARSFCPGRRKGCATLPR